MSELRVDNIVSEDGSAAPVYSKGMTIGAGQTLTCTGDFSVGGNVTFDSGATVTGVVTFSSADLQTNLSVSSLNVSGVSTFSDTVNVGAGKSIKLNGASSGYTEIIAAAGSGSTTFVLPANGGSASQYLQTDGSGVLSWQTVEASNLTRMTEVASTSGTSITFDNIPSGVRKITVSFYNVSSTGDGQTGVRVQLRYGSTTKTTGYDSIIGYTSASNTGANEADTDGFYFWINQSAERGFGHMRMTNIGSNRWVYDSNGAFFDRYLGAGAGYTDLGDSNELTGLYLSWPGGASFDNGYINVFYEV